MNYFGSLYYVFTLFFIIVLTIAAKDLVFREPTHINDALNEGDIDYETFKNLIDLYENKIDINNDPLEHLLQIPGVTSMDIDCIQQLKENKITLSSVDIDKLPVSIKDKIGIFIFTETEDFHGSKKASYRSYCQFDSSMNTANSHFIAFSSSGSGLWFRTDLFVDDKEKISVSRRNLNFNSKKCGITKIALGNYRTNLGLGLIYGHSARLRNTEDASETQSHLITTLKYPSVNFSNGILGELHLNNLKGKIIFDLDSARLPNSGFVKSQGLGGALDYFYKGISLGTVVLHTKMSCAEGRRWENIAASLFAKFKKRVSSGSLEYGLSKSGGRALYGTASLYHEKIASSIRFWDFNEKILSIYSGSLGSSDYIYVSLPEINADEVIRDQNIGEQGVSLDLEKSFKKTILYLNNMGWFNRLSDYERNYFFELGCRHDLNYNLNINSSIGSKNAITDIDRKSDYFYEISTDWHAGAWEKITAGAFLKYSHGACDCKGRVFFRIETWRLSGSVICAEIKYFDRGLTENNDSYLKLSIGEKLDLISRGFLNFSFALYTGERQRPFLGKDAVSHGAFYLKSAIKF